MHLRDRHGLHCVCICIYMIQDVLISQITSSSSASGSYSAQTPTRSNLNQGERQPSSPATGPSHQADPVSFAIQHPKPIPRSVDLYPQGRDVRILGDAAAPDYRLQRVPQVAVSGPPIMQQPMQQQMQQMTSQSMMEQMPHAPDSGTNMPGPPREPTVPAKEQELIDYWK